MSTGMRGAPAVAALDAVRGILKAADCDYDVPAIVVIGDQSSGKSSVMSSLIQLPLPTGHTTVTRAPLQIQQVPADELRVTLTYYLASSKEPVVRKFSADVLNAQADALPTAILEAQEAIRTALTATGRQSEGMVAGTSESEFWLLKDIIELRVESPYVQSAVTLIDLPGLFRPTTEDEATVEKYVKDFICKDNIIILAVAAASPDASSVTKALTVAHDVDPKHKRTLAVYTKIDRVMEDERGRVLLDASKVKGHGFVLVCNKPIRSAAGLPDFDAMRKQEEVELQGYTNPQLTMDGDDIAMTNLRARLAGLKDQGGAGDLQMVLLPESRGTEALARKLVELQEKMVEKHVPRILRKLREEREELSQQLKQFEGLPKTERGARDLIDKLLEQAADTFKRACVGQCPLGKDDEPGAPHLLTTHINQATKAYAKLQSYFIPGILGKKKVLQIVRNGAQFSTTSGHPDQLGELISVNMYNEFHGDALRGAESFLAAVHETVYETIACTLRKALCAHPLLQQKAISVAGALVDRVVENHVKGAVEDMVQAHSYIVEPLHTDAVYMTYVRMMTLASNVVIRPDSEGKVIGHVADYLKEGGPIEEGPADTEVAKNFIQMAVDITPNTPYSEPNGELVDELLKKLVQLIRDYRASYDQEEQHAKGTSKEFLEDYSTETYYLVPIAWKMNTDPVTAFDMMCKLMNCSPSYVIKALHFYFEEFEKVVKEVEKQEVVKYSAQDLQIKLINTMSRMMCSYHGMTETINKLVRFYLASDKSERSVASQLRQGILKAIQEEADEAGINEPLMALLDSDERRVQREKLLKQYDAVNRALERLEGKRPVPGRV